MNELTILLVDDDEEFSRTVEDLLGDDYGVQCVFSGRACLETTMTGLFDLILLDLRLPDISGLTVLRRLRESGSDVPVVVITAYGSVESAVAAIKLGASDYLEKPLIGEFLRETISGILTQEKYLRQSQARKGIIGECPEIHSVWNLIETFGPTDLPLLLQGETGTGKKLFARAIHETSKRREGPFIHIECAGFTEKLIESELFGNGKDAFTGDHGSKPAMMERARGGTLFLDEIGEMPASAQYKLLLTIESHNITPVGIRRRRVKQADIRFVSATIHNIEKAIKRKEFRADLYYQLAGVTIELPPIRARTGDLDILIEHFLAQNRRAQNKFGLSISTEALDIMGKYRWPGNVRELKDVIAAASGEADDIILPEHLPLNIRQARREIGLGVSTSGREVHVRAELECNLDSPIDLKEIKSQFAHQAELQIVSAARRLYRGTMAELAEFLGIDPKTLRRKLHEMGRAYSTPDDQPNGPSDEQPSD